MGRPWTTWAQVQGAMPAPASAAKRPNVSCQPPQRHQGQHTRHRLRAHRPPHPDNLGMGPFAPPCGGPSHLWPWGYGPLHSPGAMGKTEAPDARQEGGGPPRLWARWEHALALRRDGQRPQRHNAPALAVPGRGTPYDPAWAPSRAARLGGKRDKTRRGKRTLAPRWQAQGRPWPGCTPPIPPGTGGHNHPSVSHTLGGTDGMRHRLLLHPHGPRQGPSPGRTVSHPRPVQAAPPRPPGALCQA